MSTFAQSGPWCKTETRSFPPFEPPDPPPVFIEKEEKLWRLALDSAATPHEADACGIQLIRSLRKRGVDAEQILKNHIRATLAARELMAARGYVLSFGQYRGKSVGECPSDYLRWVLANCDNITPNLRRAIRIVL